MKIKALFLALVIAGATALSYTAITDNESQAIDRSKIKVPKAG
ncbi:MULTISPECIES: hypothetical protein [unclassified Dokdonia]|nr:MULTISPECIES: hypothetical protein [unclassified Dokdonia]AEE20513.1 hypothetical protein Krodi_2536 [Dokdonia sp. 4H-3-7-5]